MSRTKLGRRGVAARPWRGTSMIEGLESRQMFSAAPLLTQIPVHAGPVTPLKILAGNTGNQLVTIRNLTNAAVTENVTITPAPSLDGTTPAGSYGSPPVSQTLTINPHGAKVVKVPFVPDTSLAAGKYHTIDTVQIDADTFTVTAPGVYILTLPPAPTTTPSLVGHFSGFITAINSTSGGLFGGGGTTTIHRATFIWQTTDQATDSLTGLFAVGAGQTTGAMTGAELTDGTFQYTLTSDNINYTIKGKISADGNTLTGTFKGTLVNNIFNVLNGQFRLLRQSS